MIVRMSMLLLLTTVATLFLPLLWENILKPLGNPATLSSIMYGSCTKAMSMLYCSMICVRFEVATRECCKFNCKHLILFLCLALLVLFKKLWSVLEGVAIVNIPCLVYTSLILLACWGSSYREMSGSRLFYLPYCTDYMTYS